jgi:hypothetical protein
MNFTWASMCCPTQPVRPNGGHGWVAARCAGGRSQTREDSPRGGAAGGACAECDTTPTQQQISHVHHSACLFTMRTLLLAATLQLAAAANSWSVSKQLLIFGQLPPPPSRPRLKVHLRFNPTDVLPSQIVDTSKSVGVGLNNAAFFGESCLVGIMGWLRYIKLATVRGAKFSSPP